MMCTYSSCLIFGNDAGQIEFSLVIGEEVAALGHRLVIQGVGQSLVVFAVLPNHCRVEGRKKKRLRLKVEKTTKYARETTY